ncbi:E3 ubiquitin-protein ligase TRIM39-like [Pseudoliparis swirei]|uniref:E3 ubiquitin-protein ligase TRIM39-like n=1 Tax=Pseudoliparis swirei TaxID=2059687 RepID=UPI0024BE9471|nr:E3 ubiquitin-protein ligase TRIM39-like [Pseudoliparis swirei]
MALPVPVEEQFMCCICLDIFTDPTSTPCGHNFCLNCIEGYWDTKRECECPLCKQTFSIRPKLSINYGFAEIIDFYIRSQWENNPGKRNNDVIQLSEADGVLCDICCGDKSPSVQSCLTCMASYCELHLTPHERDPLLQRHQLMDPTSFTVSHHCRIHKKPLTMFCVSDKKPVCVRCTEREHKNHNTVPIAKEKKRVKTSLRDTKTSLKQMIQARRKKMEQITTSVDQSKEITEREIEGSDRVCCLLITSIKRNQARLVDDLEENQQEAEMRAQELSEELLQEIHELQARGIELKQLEQDQSPIHLLQRFPSRSRLPSTRDWSEVAVHADNCIGMVTRAFSKLVDICQDLSDKLSADEADKLNQYAANVTLDPETASGWLLLSPDRKKVTVSSQKTNLLPDNPQRFDSCVCVLGKQSFASGRRYWVIQVGNKPDWDLGVTRESISRKGTITVRPDNGYWAICRRQGGSLSACASPSVNLRLQETPQKVGVFLDYEEGSVSFYDAEAKTHIYTFTGCDFNEPLNPYFNPCVLDDGKNTAPLVICPLEEGVREGQDITIESAML